MSTVFGEVAGLYDRARPAYLPEVADVTLAYAGPLPRRAAEVGAGTGKGTVLFAGRGFPIVCIEPDPRMSALIRPWRSERSRRAAHSRWSGAGSSARTRLSIDW